MFTVARKPTQGEYIGRPSPLGNPFYMTNEAMRDKVCDQYQEWFDRKVEANDPKVMAELNRLLELGKQGPVKLICFCAPKRCHGDTIARFLNGKIKELK